MLTIYLLALAGPFLGAAAGAVDLAAVDPRAQAELFAFVLSSTTLLAALVKTSAWWDTLTLVQKRLVLAAPAVVGAVVAALQDGGTLQSALFAGANAGVAYLAAHLANVSERNHEARKGHEQAPPPTGDAAKPVGHPPPDPSKD